MATSHPDFTKMGFAKTFVIPALLLFLVPAASWVFFNHARNRLDEQVRELVINQILADKLLSKEQRANGIAYFQKTPVSQLVDDPIFAADLDSETRFHYATFKWMIRLAAISVASGIAVLALAGACVLLSLRSANAQYLCLAGGWHVLRIYGASQTLAQGAMLVALSYWVTALWLHIYIPKLIIFVALLAAVGVFVVIVAIFKRPADDFILEGDVIDAASAVPLWEQLRAICEKVGTPPPDNLVAGIDDNFFVTETPATVGERKLRGRTLFVSLSLLRKLNGAEAAAVMAHEMAHFSGQDTTYSRKIAPLLRRYENYLQALRSNIVTLPVFHFMLFFRALYEISIGSRSRQREFRADRVAADVVSPREFVAALLRISAYSEYRNQVERDLFSQEQALAVAKIADRIDEGFHASATAYAENTAIRGAQTAHPFDSHPPLAQRMEALRVALSPGEIQSILGNVGDGQWFRFIENANELEQSQWRAYEERFRQAHEYDLSHRYIPETDEERALVEKYFPMIQFEGTNGLLSIDHAQFGYEAWGEPIAYSDVSRFVVDDHDNLHVHLKSSPKKGRRIELKRFKKQRQELLDTIN